MKALFRIYIGKNRYISIYRDSVLIEYYEKRCTFARYLLGAPK